MGKKKKNKKLLLVVSHNLFLTKDERYTLANGKVIQTIGVSLPVWFEKGGKTTEPAEEIFCKYTVTNPINPGALVLVQRSKEGYLICLPQIPEDYKAVKLSDEAYREMTQEQLDCWYEQHAEPPNGRNLLDIKDGGAEYLRFEQHNAQKLQGHYCHIIHTVEIKKIEVLEETSLM
jgi:hypothetical protein